MTGRVPGTRTGRRLVRSAAGAAAVIGAGAALGQAGALVAALVAVAAVTAARARQRAAARRAAAAARELAEDLLAAFAAELDAGADPDTALRAATTAAVRADSHAAGAAEVARFAPGLAAGADPARLLAGCRTPALRQLGAALWVCRAGGARLAPVARTLAAQARADARQAGELAAALAGPRSSGRLVAGLPAVGLVFAALLGARPAHVLLATPAGSACLAAGVALDLVGLRWLRWIGDRVARRAEPAESADWQLRERENRPPAGPARRRPGRAMVAAVLAVAAGACAAVFLAHGQRGLAVVAAVGAAAMLVGAALPVDPDRARRERLLADLPAALDLIAACLAAGATVPAALEATAAGVAGPLGVELRAAAHGLRLGATTARATARLIAAGAAPPGPLDAVRRRVGADRPRAGPARPLVAAAMAFGRVESSGARLADALTRIAERTRAQAHDEAIGAARRAGVAAVAPLGLCFLPAFLLLGVVPAILGTLPGALPA